MKPSTILLAIATAFLSHCTAAPAPAATTSRCSRTAKFDHFPTGVTDPDVPHLGLKYSGWSVVEASPETTWFTASSKPNILKLSSSTRRADITALPGHKFNPSAYTFGCSNGTAPVTCDFSLIFPERSFSEDPSPNTTFTIYYNAEEGRMLEQAGAFNQYDSPYCEFNLYNAPDNAFLYIDNFEYSETNCLVA